MKIRRKFLLIVLPLVVAPLLVVGLAASLAARNGITRVATEFLKFKSEELMNYAATQWNLLVENELTGEPEFVRVSKLAVESFARSVIRSDTELILAVDDQGLAMATGEVKLSAAESRALAELRASGEQGWRSLELGGERRVAQTASFEPFGWYLLVTEAESTFYRAVNQIFWQSGLVLIVALGVTLVLLFVFTRYITQPLGNVVGAMKDIISTSDLSRKVELLYKDETGELGHTFNLMTAELERAYNQIKSYAFKAVIAQKREQKVRSIFQKYVPADVIDQFFAHPEKMLVGEERVVAVLFSDIRGFTTFAEQLKPEEVVEVLNAYFTPMVDVVYAHNGIVDKYMGDALMAFYGAPVKHEDDALQAALTGLDMLEELESFNERQRKREQRPFHIGIGINYGVVTVGNIGSEKKMDYTVMGDGVNLASRIEELTKIYDVPFMVSEAVQSRIKEQVPCRLVDKVAVKGREGGVRIYHPKRELSKEEAKGWKLHETGTDHYYDKQFEKAAKYFTYAQEYLPRDPILRIFLARCQRFAESPPPESWQGVTAITEK
ncbi:MAG: HAMP domain-containing protein [Spirochaetales bacterium]|nr:HAMP domain-containing protein [Spirochaetales bacterium]